MAAYQLETGINAVSLHTAYLGIFMENLFSFSPLFLQGGEFTITQQRITNHEKFLGVIWG
jgi:hypothetical protein